MTRTVLLSLLFVGCISGCSAHYSIARDSVYFVTYRPGFDKHSDKVNDADADSFQPLSAFYGKDDKRVYWSGQSIEGADSASFRVLNDYYGIDSRRAYFTDRALPESDPQTFSYLGDNWSRDSTRVYYTSTLLNVCDISTFGVLWSITSSRALDSKCYYYKDKRVPIDRATLEVLSGNFAKDATAVYWADIRIEGADPRTFEVHENEYIARDNRMCFGGPKSVSCHDLDEIAQKFCRCGK